jgi:hypothetical protein
MCRGACELPELQLRITGYLGLTTLGREEMGVLTEFIFEEACRL